MTQTLHLCTPGVLGHADISHLDKLFSESCALLLSQQYAVSLNWQESDDGTMVYR